MNATNQPQSNSRELLEAFFETGTRLTYKKGDTIIRPQDDPDGIYLITEGFVKAYSITKYDEENLLLMRGKGNVFPLIWAFTGEHGGVSYVAMNNVSLLRVGRDEYMNFLRDKPEVTPVILGMTIESYKLNSQRVMTLSYRTARERIVSFLLTMAERFGSPAANNGVLIEAPLKQADIASSVNATRETTSREINTLKKKGLLTIQSSRIQLLDTTELAKIIS